MEGCRYTRGRSVCARNVMKTTKYQAGNKNKSDFTTRKVCVPLVPVRVCELYLLAFRNVVGARTVYC